MSAGRLGVGQMRMGPGAQVFVVVDLERGRGGEERTMVVLGTLSDDGAHVSPREARGRSTVIGWPLVGRVRLGARRPCHAVGVVR